MKRIFLLFLTVAVLAALCCFAGAATVQIPVSGPGGSYTTQSATRVTLSCDGVPLQTDVPAFLANNCTMVPIRVISEKLGATVGWEQETQTVTISLDGHELLLPIGSETATVDGQTARLPGGVPAILIRYEGVSRTMVPVRFVTEQLGRAVSWDAATYNVDIQTARPDAAQIAEPVLTDGALVFSCGETAPVQFSLPGRLVFDLPGAVIPTGGGMLPVDGAQIARVRYSQYDTGDYGYARVVRVVLDLCDGVAPEELTVTQEDGVVYIPVEPLAAQPPIEEEPQAPDIQTDPPAEEEPPVDEPPIDPPTPDDPGTAPEGSGFVPLGPWLSTPIEVPDDIYAINLLDRSFVDDGQTIICLDAGHGGRDPGTLYQNIQEKDITLAVTLRLGQMLEADGYTVVYTRTDDRYVSLSDRVRFANLSWADVFLSIHVNSCDTPSVSGIETYHWSRSDAESRALAQSVQGYLVAHTGAESRGVKTADYTVIHHTIMPAALAEIGFLSNVVECARMTTDEYQTQIATGLYRGLTAYIESYEQANGMAA